MLLANVTAGVRQYFALSLKIWLGLLLLSVWIWALTVPIAEVAISPGVVFKVQAAIAGRANANGGLSFYGVSIDAARLTPIEFAWDTLNPNDSFVPGLESGSGVSQGPLTRSQEAEIAAAVAAAKYLRLPVRTIPGVVVKGVLPLSPARNKLAVGDLIVSVNGVRVTSLAALDAAVALHPGQPYIELGFLRYNGAGKLLHRTATLRIAFNAGRLGLVVSPALGYSIPFALKLSMLDSQLSTAALSEALAVVAEYRTLPGLHGGHLRVAAVGSVTASGQVLPVIGIRQRVVAARLGGLSYLLVPKMQVAQAEVVSLGRVRIVGVSSLAQAVSAVSRGAGIRYRTGVIH